ncbi:uncharacterized protein KZ484_019326 [Pholidichthys leucotaenia]
MKIHTASLTSFLCSATSLAILLLFINWAQQVVAHPVDLPLSPPLHNPQTSNDVREVSRHHQDKLTEEDASFRLMPQPDNNLDHMQICCLHVNILDFYLKNILHQGQHQHLHRLKSDLHRVSVDLQTQGCNVTQYHEHQHAVEFRTNYFKMAQKRGSYKAIGELDILFSYLRHYCIKPRNGTNTEDADDEY